MSFHIREIDEPLSSAYLFLSVIFFPHAVNELVFV